MKTEKEKQLEIDLLVEKIQRISKKKVVFKEDVYYGDRYPKKTDSEVEKEIKEAILEVVNIDDETETLSVSKGGELVSFQCKFYTNNKGKRVRGAVHNVAEWDDTIESIQRIYPDYEVINKTLNGFALSNYNSKSPLKEVSSLPIEESTDNIDTKNYIAIARWTEDGEEKWDVIGGIGEEKLDQKEAEELARKSYSSWNKNAPEGGKTSDVQYKALVVTQARYDQLLSEEK